MCTYILKNRHNPRWTLPESLTQPTSRRGRHQGLSFTTLRVGPSHCLKATYPGICHVNIEESWPKAQCQTPAAASSSPQGSPKPTKGHFGGCHCTRSLSLALPPALMVALSICIPHLLHNRFVLGLVACGAL